MKNHHHHHHNNHSSTTTKTTVIILHGTPASEPKNLPNPPQNPIWSELGEGDLAIRINGLNEKNNSDMNIKVSNADNESITSDHVVNRTKSYVNMARKDEISKKLNFRPTVTNDIGTEVVVFDEILVRKGNERWNLTASGYFVGYRMSPYELRYNIRRMWGKFGVRDIIVNNDGTRLFKFRDSNGLNSVAEKGPWMVNGKPLIVQKWNHELGMQMSEHRNPLIMDTTTATMCHNGMGRLDYARVLVEMDGDKEFKKVIELQYKDSENKVKGTKRVNVSYDWKPNACTYCKVFVHKFKGCTIRPKTLEEEEAVKRKEEELHNPKNDNMDNFGVQDKMEEHKLHTI
ncbi:RNA-directed DNA polymerase, eukaryota, reverse transcriptase zinc-binding domain protein [Tanacetum coccineum]|uniref:RNA-directed DNA polymerase, eukaryota, reverse transcriptase zinc-binding domain protein n=1 Tax=Tanacetum coccineum TaxID=301880 RepID=A0ABQ5F9F6_9ASTR